MTGEVQAMHPPAAILKIVNPVGRFLLQSPLGRRMTSQAVLRFTGRKTGTPYTVVVTWNELDGKAVIISPFPWRHNFKGGAPLLVRHGGVDIQGQGVLDADTVHIAAAVNQLMADGTPGRALGLKVVTGHQVTPADAAALHLGMVRFEPAG